MELHHKKHTPSNKANNGDFQELLQSLEQQTGSDGLPLYKYRGLWGSDRYLQNLLSFYKHYKFQKIDVLLVTSPKSGTTWLKALAYSIATRGLFDVDQSPLLTSNPHELVHFIEFDFDWEQEDLNQEHAESPRIFASHIPFRLLPESILESDCRIIYLCRNPLDQFISLHHYLIENRVEKDAVQLELDEAVEKFSQGVHPAGPFWDHMLGYWNAHLENPEKIMYLKYEDLKENITSNVKKIAEFMGCAFSLEEEKEGVIEQISSLCSFDKLKSLEVNKTGLIYGEIAKSSFFRKGEVGDWSNHLTPAMAERIKKMMETKFKGSGLVFEG